MREFGYLVPDHMIFRSELSDEAILLPSLLESQKPFWARMERMAENLADKQNPAYAYQRYTLRLASKVANNLGFMQVERGEALEAMDTFRHSRRLDSGNISALLNLFTIAKAKDLPEAAEHEAAWEAFKGRHMDSRVMWSLSALYGYVHNTAYPGSPGHDVGGFGQASDRGSRTPPGLGNPNRECRGQGFSGPGLSAQR